MLRSVLSGIDRKRFAAFLKAPNFGRRRGAGTEGGNGYRWECPVCGESRVNTMDEYGSKSLGALKSHVRNSDWGEHGAARSYPADLDVRELYQYVSPVSDE